MNLQSALTNAGLLVTNLIYDGEIQRCGTIRKPRAQNGWYIAHSNGKLVVFGNWENGDGHEVWSDGEIAPQDYQLIEKLKAAKENQYNAASKSAQELLETYQADGFSEYLKRKRCYPYGAKFDSTNLIIPVQDSGGKIWSFQRVYPDGSKYFMMGGRTRGCYFPIFPARNVAKDERIVVCEGFATGATIHQETGLPVIVAFSAGNIKPVCDSLEFRNILIAADNDASGVGERYAKESGYPYVMPKVEGWDYNDVFLNGKDLKSDFLNEGAEKREIITHGLVQEIADWITQTAIRPQPELSLAAALAFVGLIKGHKIEGATSLRTNLLVLSLAPTGGGKEHPQACINRLAYTCGLSKSLLGEPVSGAGFLTGLLEANRVGLLVMDEMGRFIGNISGKSGGAWQREIIDYMIKSFSKASGILHGRQYGDSKKNPRIDVIQPHFCCLGSTVKERMQAACTSSEIIDGFLNRWLVFSTDERPERNRGASRISPPFELVEKIKEITGESPRYDIDNQPTPKEVKFIRPAWVIFEAFRDKMDTLVATSPYPLNMLYGRSAEHAEKVALVLCNDDEIITSDILAAITIVERSNQAIAEFVGLISDNQSEADFIKVREKIRTAKEIKKSTLTYSCQFVQGGAKRIAEIVQVLLDSNQISERKVANKIFYKWIG
jgi:Toprim domain